MMFVIEAVFVCVLMYEIYTETPGFVSVSVVS